MEPLSIPEARAKPRISSLFPVAEALMAAAHSDRPPSMAEHEAVRDALCRLLDVDELPERLEQRLQSFDPGTVDLHALAKELIATPVIGRKSLVELTRAVCDADGSLDLS